LTQVASSAVADRDALLINSDFANCEPLAPVEMYIRLAGANCRIEMLSTPERCRPTRNGQISAHTES
jgi:hypothetical protein